LPLKTGADLLFELALELGVAVVDDELMLV
jgi:hypothetical protein